ncbi:hypothetical protein [Microvirga tunisiensis]|uniref:Uncharacterized protein n=1 Tax=Microvirga tunisiensis TaxID=2108360 RepID=A0A5N7MH32_9HYPH|nr:hypothetical protein [Microvirga tunisiensis]MPR07822.1 hypothetical protein [Microvirga tunisiensis]MPR26217.1 hypothetical protein [Microvirga tunisiensis]
MDRDIAGVLSGAAISDEIRERGHAEAIQHGLTYLDIPTQPLDIGNGAQLRSLFILTDRARDHERLLYTAILIIPGQTNWRRVQWYSGGSDILPDDLAAADQAYMEVLSVPGASTHTEPLLDVVERSGRNLRDMLVDIESFALLALTYMSLHEVEAPWPTLPYAHLDDPRRCGRKAKQAAKKFSLFRAQRVSAAPGTIRRSMDRDCGSERKLGRRTEVRGHFRLQAYGSQYSQRRLLWIAPHMRGPLDGILSTALVRPECANDQTARRWAA